MNTHKVGPQGSLILWGYGAPLNGLMNVFPGGIAAYLYGPHNSTCSWARLLSGFGRSDSIDQRWLKMMQTIMELCFFCSIETESLVKFEKYSTYIVCFVGGGWYNQCFFVFEVGWRMLTDLVEANSDVSNLYIFVKHWSFKAGVLIFWWPELIHQWLEIPMSQRVKTSCFSSSIRVFFLGDRQRWRSVSKLDHAQIVRCISGSVCIALWWSLLAFLVVLALLFSKVHPWNSVALGTECGCFFSSIPSLKIRNHYKRAPRKASKSVLLVQSSQERRVFFVGRATGHTNTQTFTDTNRPFQKYIWDLLQGNSHAHALKHQSIAVLVLGCIVCAYYYIYRMYDAYT